MQDVVIKIKGDSSDIVKLANELKKLGKVDEDNAKQFDENNKKHKEAVKDTTNEYKQLSQLLQSAKSYVAGFFAVQGIISFGKAVIDITAQFQKFNAVLSNTLGPTGGQKAFRDIQAFAAQTPFSVQELTDSFVKLTNSGFKPTMDEMRKLGDLASAKGKDFNQLAEALIDAQTQEFERLKEFGVRAKVSGDQVSFTFNGVTKTVKNTSQEIQNYVMSLGDIEGVAGGMAKVSETLGGKISNLGDSWDRFLYGIGEAATPVLGGTIDLLGDLLSGITSYLESPVSEALMNEQAQLNNLAVKLNDTNIKEDERRQIIDQMIQIYPSLLDGLDKEKVKNEEIMLRIADVNKQYAIKVGLQRFDEKHADVMADQADASIRLNKATAELTLQIGRQLTAQEQLSLARARGVDPKNLNEMAKIAAAFGREQMQVQDLVDAQSEYLQALGESNKANKEANKTLQERANLQKMLEGATGTALVIPPPPPRIPPPTSTGGTSKGKPAELKEELTILEALQKAYDDLAKAVDRNAQSGKVDRDMIQKRDEAQKALTEGTFKYEQALLEANGMRQISRKEIQFTEIDEKAKFDEQMQMMEKAHQETMNHISRQGAEQRKYTHLQMLTATFEMTIGFGRQLIEALNLQGKDAEAAQKGFALADIAISTAKAISALTASSTQVAGAVAAASGPAGVFTGPAAYAAYYGTQIVTILANMLSAKQLLGYKDGTPSLQRNGNPAGVDTIPIMANEGEAIIPTEKNRQKPGLAAAWIKGNLDDYINVNYVIPALKRNKIDKDEAFASRIGKAISMSASFNDMNLLQSDKENRRILRSIDKTLKSGSMGLSRRKF